MELFAVYMMKRIQQKTQVYYTLGTFVSPNQEKNLTPGFMHKDGVSHITLTDSNV